RSEGLRDFGASMSPMNAFQILQGIETLPLRMARHIENTRRIANFLAEHPQVASVSHPDLPSHPDHALATRLMPRGCSAALRFELAGHRAAGRRLVENRGLFAHLANVGDARSLVIHAASTTHFRMDAAALEAAGIREGTLRLSIGLEDPEDLVADLKGAFRAAARG